MARAIRIKRSDIRKAATTRLERHVAAWIIRQAEDYPDTGAAGVFQDLQHGGCSSGYVGHLIYTTECVAFYRKYQRDIWDIACKGAEDRDADNVFAILSGCNHNDTSDYDLVANFLAWLGFEEAARTIADRVGYQD